MKPLTLTICGMNGFIFEGEIPQTYCFVPEECLLPDGDGMRVAEGDYIRSRWDVRNMRCNDTGEGQRLFPNPLKPIADMNSELAKIFLRRIRSMHCD